MAWEWQPTKRYQTSLIHRENIIWLSHTRYITSLQEYNYQYIEVAGRNPVVAKDDGARGLTLSAYE
jgi:hypothetical protein